MTLQLRTAINRLNRWRWERLRPATRKAMARVRSMLPALPLPLGWMFLTWSMFLWRPRAWAASVGIYLFLTGVMPVVELYFKARATRGQARIDR